MSTDTDPDADPDANAQPNNQNASYVVNHCLSGAGEFGNRFLALLLIYLANADQITAGSNPLGQSSLSVITNDNVNIQSYFTDVDFQITNEIEQLIGDSDLWQYYEDKVLTLIGDGGGREWRKVRNFHEEFPQLDDHLTEAVTANPVPHVTLEFAGLTGATGMGRIRRHFDRIWNGDLPSPADHAGIYLPVTVAPALRLHDQQVDAIDADHRRLAFQNIFEHRPVFRQARADGIITGDIFADNALLGYQEFIHQETPQLSTFRNEILDIRLDDDWEEIIETVRYGDELTGLLDNGSANDSLARSLLLPLYATLKPEKLHFVQGDSHFDRQDYFGELNGATWLPGHFWADSLAEVSSAVPDAGRPSNVHEALYPATRYAAYTIPAGFNLQAVERAIVFVHARDETLSGQDYGTISRTLADELGINNSDVTTVQIKEANSQHFPGENDPELALNVLVGVNEVETSYKKLGEQAR